MNTANRNGNAFPRIGRPKKALLRIAFRFALFVTAGFLATPFLAQAGSVTVTLGQSAQNETLTGLGPNASGIGQYLITLGACTAAGGSTTCILSGAFTSTTAGLTSGTYSLATTYVGTGPSPLQGTQISAGSNLWSFSSIPATATITLTLVSSSGTFIVPIVTGSTFAAGAGIGFGFGFQVGCSGTPVSSCTVAQVGVTAGAIMTGPPTGIATFNQGDNYYFSDLVFSGGYQTTLTYVNYSPQTVTCTTNFYSDLGAPLAVPFAQGSVSTRTDTMLPGASVHDQTIATLAPPFVEGWAQASCTGPVQASLLYRLYQSGVAVGEASVNAETSATPVFATFAQTATGIAYANPSKTLSATVTVEVYSTTGTPIGSQIVTLGPLAHGSANVGPLLGLSHFTGFVKITSTAPIVCLSLNAEAFPVFSSLPPGDLPNGTLLVSP